MSFFNWPWSTIWTAVGSIATVGAWIATWVLLTHTQDNFRDADNEKRIAKWRTRFVSVCKPDHDEILKDMVGLALATESSLSEQDIQDAVYDALLSDTITGVKRAPGRTEAVMQEARLRRDVFIKTGRTNLIDPPGPRHDR